uniref:Uncharacterized protein n=1 Tax=Anguilla anguilla TaxID=7936 RepID=A0A0E9PMR6_ANGAN
MTTKTHTSSLQTHSPTPNHTLIHFLRIENI